MKKIALVAFLAMTGPALAQVAGPGTEKDRYFDRYLTDDHANRLVRVDVETKELRDLTPGYDRRFTVDGEMEYDLAPDGDSVAIRLNSTPPPYRDFLNSMLQRVSQGARCGSSSTGRRS